MKLGKVDFSFRTSVLFWVGLALLLILSLTALVTTVSFAPDKAELTRGVVSDAGSVVFGFLAAAFLFYAASRFAPKSSLRRVWQLLGIGIGLRAVGDVVWIALEVGARFKSVPYPSAADVFYVAMYVFMAAGLIRAAWAFGRATYAEGAVRFDIIAMFLVAVGVYTFVIAPILVDGSSTLPMKVLGAAYPIGDIVLLMGPALFIAVVASCIGRCEPAWHWWALSIGVAVMSLADILFTWLDWTGRYASGNPVDYLWMLSLLMIAVAGSLSADTCAVHVTEAVPVRKRSFATA